MAIAEGERVDNVRGMYRAVPQLCRRTDRHVVLGQDPLIPPDLLQSEIPSVR